MSLVHAQDREQSESTPEVAPDKQRDSLGELLRTLDFAQATEALTPDAPNDRGGAPPKPQRGIDPGALKSLAQLAPVAIGQVDAAEGKSSDGGGEGAGATPEAKDGEGSEQDEAAQVQSEAELEGESEPDVGPEDSEESELSDGHDAAPEQEHDAPVQHAPVQQAPVQMKAKKGKKAKNAKPKPKARPKPKAKPRVKASGLLLNYKQARKAFLWTKKRNFAKHPFLLRRYQRVLSEPANGVLSFAFVQAVARYQKRLGVKVNGALVGAAAKMANWALRKVYKADKKLLLTAIEVKQAQHWSRRMIKTKRLKRATVKEIQRLIGHVTKPPGAFTPGFLRAIAAFQRKHGLSPSGAMGAGTIKKVRQELSEGPWRRPSEGRLSSPFGMRWHPKHGGWRHHSGVDFAAGAGTPILAAKGGTVTYAGGMGGYGNTVDIQHKNGFKTRYAHCSALYVKVGQKVSNGQRVAAVGSTGVSTGPHLHFEIHKGGSPVNPQSYI